MSKIITGIAVLVALLFAVMYFTKSVPVTTPTQNFGASSGPESSNTYSCNNGFCRYFYRQPVKQATSTLCAVLSPTSTSTLSHASLVLTTTAGYTNVFTISNATTAYASTTVITNMGSASNGQLTAIATTSATALTDGVIPPNTYVNFRVSTSSVSSSSTFSPVGFCEVSFTGI